MAKITPGPSTLRGGRLGKNILYQSWKGIYYARTKPWPPYTNSVRQQEVRAAFAMAVKLWQTMLTVQKTEYRRKAKGKGMSGYELWIKEYMETHT